MDDVYLKIIAELPHLAKRCKSLYFISHFIAIHLSLSDCMLGLSTNLQPEKAERLVQYKLNPASRILEDVLRVGFPQIAAQTRAFPSHCYRREKGKKNCK